MNEVWKKHMMSKYRVHRPTSIYKEDCEKKLNFSHLSLTQAYQAFVPLLKTDWLESNGTLIIMIVINKR